MKPKFRPGKVATRGKDARAALSKAKSVLLKREAGVKKTSKKEGRGGERAHWDIDYEEGISYAQKEMKGAEYENFSHEGIRRLPKKGGTR